MIAQIFNLFEKNEIEYQGFVLFRFTFRSLHQSFDIGNVHQNN